MVATLKILTMKIIFIIYLKKCTNSKALWVYSIKPVLDTPLARKVVQKTIQKIGSYNILKLEHFECDTLRALLECIRLLRFL